MDWGARERERERGGNASGGGGGFEAGDASGDVFDEIVTSAKAFRFVRFGGSSRSRKSVDFEFRKSSVSGRGGRWKKGGKNVVAVVKRR